LHGENRQDEHVSVDRQQNHGAEKKVSGVLIFNVHRFAVSSQATQALYSGLSNNCAVDKSLICFNTLFALSEEELF